MEKAIKFDILGDISLAWWDTDKNKIDKISEKINSCLGNVDYRIANLESPIVGGSELMPIDKDGPNLKITEEQIDFLENLNVDGYTLANNHIGDFGGEGVRSTIKVLEKLHKDYTGSAFRIEDTYKPLRKEIKGIRLSIFSICEHEFGIVSDNCIGAAGYNSEIMRNLLKQENEWADCIIVIFHGGNENYPFPSPKVRDRYHLLVDEGADIIIGMHSHCPQGYESYKDSLIIYSLGNFFFPRESESIYETWKFGYIARLHITRDNFVVENIPYTFDTYGTDFELVEKQSFSQYIEEISRPIHDKNRLESLFKGWAAVKGNELISTLKKCMNDIDDVNSLCVVKNLFSCEAHEETMETYLNMKYEKHENNYYKEISEIKDYINISDWVLQLNMKINHSESLSPKENIIICWGVGKKAEDIYNDYNSKGFQIIFTDADRFKRGLYYINNLVISPEEAISCYKDAIFYICTGEKNVDSVKNRLLNAGISQDRIRI
jgi:poly-gamma-glutamate synthesis protein (capsule biosynthesis protein)